MAASSLNIPWLGGGSLLVLLMNSKSFSQGFTADFFREEVHGLLEVDGKSVLEFLSSQVDP